MNAYTLIRETTQKRSHPARQSGGARLIVISGFKKLDNNGEVKMAMMGRDIFRVPATRVSSPRPGEGGPLRIWIFTTGVMYGYFPP